MWVSEVADSLPFIANSCMSSSERKCIHITGGSSNSFTWPTSGGDLVG